MSSTIGVNNRVGVIGVGSESTALLVAEIAADGLRELDRRSTMTLLARGLGSGQRLDTRAMTRVMSIVAEFDEIARTHGPSRTVALFSSAVRDARNGARFAAAIGDRHHLPAHILTGPEEASLVFDGVIDQLAAHPPTSVIDIGGGSTELAIGTRAGIIYRTSLQIGSVRQAEIHLARAGVTANSLDAIIDDAALAIAGSLPTQARTAPRSALCVASSQTWQIGLDALAQSGHRPSKLTLGELEAALDGLVAVEPRVPTTRAKTIATGLAILVSALRSFNLHRVSLTDRGLLHGAALHLGRARAPKAWIAGSDDPG